MKRICTICARGGSQGVKGKNLRPLAGKPLLAHTVEQAVACGLFDAIAVSSDSAEILDTAVGYGATERVDRPAELASDHAAKEPAIRHCVEEVERRLQTAFDIIVDLDVTAPLRLPEDIAATIALVEREGAGNVITACPAERSPYFNMVREHDGGRVDVVIPVDPPYLRRQDAPPCFDMNASIYVWSRETFFQEPTPLFQETTRLHVMPRERSIDIDTELDFEIAAFLVERRRQSS